MITASAKAILETWICSWCKAVFNKTGTLKILTDKQFEQAGKDNKTSHGICAGCQDKEMIKIANFKRGRKK